MILGHFQGPTGRGAHYTGLPAKVIEFTGEGPREIDLKEQIPDNAHLRKTACNGGVFQTV